MADDFGLLVRWKLLKAASADRRLTRADWGVLMAVLDRIDDSTGVAWPGLGRIAKDADLNRSSAVRSVGRLTELGYLVRESGTHGRSNRYRMGRCGAETRCSNAARRASAPEVGAAVRRDLGAAVHPERTHLNLLIEPASPRATTNGSKRRGAAAAAPRQSVRDSFHDVTYTGTPDEQLPEYLRPTNA